MGRDAWAQAAHIIDYLQASFAGLSFGRRQRIDLQGVNFCLHHRPQGRVNKPVALDSASLGECVGDDRHLEMAQTVAGASVSFVQVTLIFHLQVGRRKRGLESVPNLLYTVRAHGSTNLNGLTVTSR